MNGLMVFQAGLGVLSLLAYGIILGILFRRPNEFSNAYYGIIKYGGLVDIVVYLWDWFFNRLVTVASLVPFYRTIFYYFPWLPALFWLNHAFFHAAQLQVVLAGVQRVCLLARPILADMSFRRSVNWIFTFMPVYCLIISVPIIWVHPTIADMGMWIVYNMSNIQPNPFIICYFSVLGAIYILVEVAILITSIICLIKYRNTLNAIRRLFFISFFVGVTRLFVLIIGTLSTLNDYGNWGWEPWFGDVLLPWIMDLTLLSSPWLHLAFNRAIQRRLLVIFRIKEENQVQIVLPIAVEQRK